ncbi:hypothetical protein QX25_10470 [Stutzerimonas stutzeri]|nr:hypothetical protein QX25_10470 [Stutzerimonas stutzeri]KZX63886.1 hypothetical protein A3710_15970 [Stutzerimonas frequens]
MKSDHPPSIFIIWCIAHQALFKAPQREDLVGRRVVPEQAFRIAADILRQLSVTGELSQELFGLDDAAGSFVRKGQCGYLLIQSTTSADA